MKLSLFIVSLLLTTHIIYAQDSIVNRNWIAGGSLGFTSQVNGHPSSLIPFVGQTRIISLNNNDFRNNYFSFSPYIGKKLGAKWVMGLQLFYSRSQYDANDVETDFFGNMDTIDIARNENGYTIGIFGRYMFNPESKFVFFLQPYANYSIVDEKYLVDDIVEDSFDSYAISIGTTGGVLYNISERWRITSRLGFLGFTTGKWMDKESDESHTFSSFGTTLNLSSLNLGFEYRF